MRNWNITAVLLSIIGLCMLPSLSYAEEAANNDFPSLITHNLWILIASLLVFIMHLGFASLESGLTRAKNTVNILSKNLIIFSIGFLIYAFIGFQMMYPGDSWIIEGLLGFGGLGLDMSFKDPDKFYTEHYTYWSDFIFQAMFAVTAATIVSGAVAERIRLPSFFIITFLYMGLIYPIVGSWQWGGGVLSTLGFYDFAGATIVHSVGGWCALVAVIFLGPRYGKYKNGKIIPIYGHNIPLVYIGVFLLWFGWFGFNGGSVLSANPHEVSYVFLITMIGAVSGVIGAAVMSIIVLRTTDLSMVLNGVLAGLVGITAGANVFSPIAAVIIGMIAGCLVVLSILLFDRVRIDDPVGAISVHLICGIWGTLAVGIWSVNPEHLLITQLIGVTTVGAFCFTTAAVIVLAVKYTLGIRVSKEEELKGLDIIEHKSEAYKGFQIFTTE